MSGPVQFTIADRAEGKTTAAVKMLIEDKSLVLVCAHETSADYARTVFRRLGGIPEHPDYRLAANVKKLLEGRITTFDALQHSRGGPRHRHLIFDDADVILQRLFRDDNIVRVFASGVKVPL